LKLVNFLLPLVSNKNNFFTNAKWMPTKTP
jgi:hypothetical protein